MAALQQMEIISGQDDFSTETQLAISRRQDFDKAEELLRQRDYQGLRLFLAQCKASGRVGAELDGFEPLPDALEQLFGFQALRSVSRIALTPATAGNRCGEHHDKGERF
jgi:hypothetical protein